jgi:hypothetical protein
LGWLLGAAACSGDGADAMSGAGTGDSTGDPTGASDADGSESTGEPPQGQARCGPDPPGPTGWVDSIPTPDPEIAGGDAIVHTGTQLLTFGAREGDAIGGIYDFATRTWQPMNTQGAPEGIRDASLVWTGDRMIAWGGVTATGVIDVVAIGGVYDPASDTWQPMSTDGAPDARRSAVGVWTGVDAIFWGGSTWSSDPIPDSQYLGSGGRYDPAADAWMPMDAGPVRAETRRGITWTGTELIVAGTAGAARYDPATDTWSILCSALALDAASHVWHGAGLISFGGYESLATQHDPVDRGGRSIEGDPCERFDTSTVGAPSGRKSHTAVWTGSEMIVFGGRTKGGTGTLIGASDGASYDPTTDTWTPLQDGTPGGRADHRAIWTGTEMIVWGGSGDGDVPIGCIYRP